MHSTKSKCYMKLAGQSRFFIFIKKDGDIIMIEKKSAEEKYCDYNDQINKCQWLVRPERP